MEPTEEQDKEKGKSNNTIVYSPEATKTVAGTALIVLGGAAATAAASPLIIAGSVIVGIGFVLKGIQELIFPNLFKKK